jgi:hypothetical protein
MLYGEGIDISIKGLTKNDTMKKKSFFLLLILIICLLVRYRLYNNLIPNFVFNVVNPRQLQGIFNIIFYLGIVFQTILVISIIADYKKMKIRDFIIAGFSLLFLISFIILMFTI